VHGSQTSKIGMEFWYIQVSREDAQKQRWPIIWS